MDITYRYAHMFPTEQTQMAKLLNEEFKEGDYDKTVGMGNSECEQIFL